MLHKFQCLLMVFVIISSFLSAACDNEKAVNNSDFNYDALYNTWQFSEFNNDIFVFVPEGYEQPPILPARAFTFYKGKKFVKYYFGPADETIEYTGKWQMTDQNHISITFDKNQKNKPEDYVIEIILLKENRLKIRKEVL